MVLKFQDLRSHEILQNSYRKMHTVPSYLCAKVNTALAAFEWLVTS